MWIYFYKSEKRIRDLAYQIAPSALAEKTKKNEKEGAVQGELSGGIPQWVELLGFKGEGKVGVDTKIIRSDEEKYPTLNIALIDVVRNFFLSNDHTFIHEDSDLSNIIPVKNLLRVKGLFSPDLEGLTGTERIANFERLQYITWHGRFKNFVVSFGTSKESYDSKTPVFQCLSSQNKELLLEVYGTLNELDGTSINILPLFFGTDLNI